MNNAKDLPAQTLQYKHSSLPHSTFLLECIPLLLRGPSNWETFAFSVTLSDVCVSVYIQVFSITTPIQGFARSVISIAG